MADDKLNDIINALDIQAFFERQGIVFAKNGTEKGWYVDCPFCESKGKLHLSRQGLWKCYKCGETGNAITLYAKLHHCNNGQAVRAIKQFMGIDDGPRPVTPRATSQRPPRVNQKVVPINSSISGGGLSEENGQADATSGNTAGSTAMEAVQPRDVYQRLVKVATLTDAHREELRTKRGFTDATIERLAFRSCGQHMVQVIEQLKAEFGERPLLKAGLLVEANGNLFINDQLLENRILIPYLDEQGYVYHLRPHKLGFKGIPSEAYCRYLLQDNRGHIVLTEGEFKAAALQQWGFAALGIPGVSSFAGTNFERLVELLKAFLVKSVTIVFDNEEKGNPQYPNYKERVEDRYDTQAWSYITGWKLSKVGFDVRIGWLPDAWRQNGKADWDGALAAGHNVTEVKRVIDAAVTPREFLESLDEEAKRVVQKKVTRFFANLPIRREFNKYVADRKQGDHVWTDIISNFVINIKSSFFTSEGVIRNVQLVNEYGEVSETFALHPGDMAGLNEWKKFCFSKGNYVFQGRSDDLINIWKLEFLRDSGELIYQPDRIGRIAHDLWLFGNLAIKGGQVYRPDNDGIIWIDGKGYKPQSLQINAKGEAVEDAIPALYEGDIDIRDVAHKLRQSVGGYEAYIGLGWVIATIFSEDIFAKYKVLPILFPHGKRESGKSTFMRWLMSFFGIETEGTGIAETSQNFIARALSYYSSLGVWFDEYRNEAKVIAKDGFFRSAYNRQLSGKGTATAFQARGFAVHGSLAISGEELPQDNGLFTRCVPIQLSANRRDRAWYDWLNRQADKFSGFVYRLILEYDQYKDKILEYIAELKEDLVARDISDRTAENWAICAGAFLAVVEEDPKFVHWVGQACEEIKRTGEQEHMLNQFWEDIEYLYSAGELNTEYLKVVDDSLFIWFNSVYEAWALHFRRKTGREPFDRASILKYMKDEPYYGGPKTIRLGRFTKRMHEILVKQSTETIQELAEMVKAEDQSAS